MAGLPLAAPGIHPAVRAALSGNELAVRAASTTRGRSWAQMTVPPPTLPSGPLTGHAPSTTPYGAGLTAAVVFVAPPQAALGSCMDRIICDPLVGALPLNACTSAVNPVPPPRAALPPLVTCTRGRDIRPAGHKHHPAAGYMICQHCQDHAFDQQWAVDIRIDTEGVPIPLPGTLAPPPVPPLLPPPQNLGVTTQFLTHLCVDCENFEEHILHQRQTGMHFGLSPAERQQRRNYPYTTCKCGILVQPNHGGNLCIRDRHDTASKQHDDDLIVRQQNDVWLRFITRQLGQPPGAVAAAHMTLVNGRAHRGIYRACRCGAEIKFFLGYVPRVYMCMGCEGVVHHNQAVRVVPPSGRRRTRQWTKLEQSLIAGNFFYRLRR